MRFWIKTNAWWLRGAHAIVLRPFMFFKKDSYLWNNSLYRHELEHCYQIQRMGTLRFYAVWLYQRVTRGYENIDVEKEAWAIQYTGLTQQELEWRHDRKIVLPKHAHAQTQQEETMGRKNEKKGLGNFVLKYLGLIIAAGIIAVLAFRFWFGSN